MDAGGSDVSLWTPGQRVGVGWHSGHCFICHPCRRNNFINCRNEKIPAIHVDGGYAERLIAAAEAVAAIPDERQPQGRRLGLWNRERFRGDDRVQRALCGKAYDRKISSRKGQ